ncbi:MAG TPA: DUF177 domain-containing protein [Syntrophorhabdaceae bacterium]|nr:DUF177 domain-containing protein [Syntrophorhabdaceae bacterium]
MIIRLSDIDDTLTLKGSMEASRFMEVEKTDFHLATPVEYELLVRKFDTLLTISGSVGFGAAFTCGRCLDEFKRTINLSMNIRVTPKQQDAPQSSEAELKDEDIDVYHYEGDEIDIDPFIYEEVLLNMPFRPLCREDCKGLCGVCGKNQNIETCNCHETSDTLLGEKLKSFLN